MSPVQLLKTEYLKRRARNPHYSMRSFARDIGVSQGLLSNILNLRRSFTAVQKIKIANALRLTVAQKEAFLGISMRSQAVRPFVETELEFDLNWRDVAVMDFVTLKGFKSDVKWMAKKLNATPSAILESLERLEARGLIRYQGDQILKTHRKIYFCPKKSQKHVRQYHRDMTRKALVEMEKTDDRSFPSQDFRGLTLAINPDRLPEAKERLKKFIEEMGDLLPQGDCTQLYQFNMQLFPLSTRLDEVP